jgi:hypothetical protein
MLPSSKMHLGAKTWRIWLLDRMVSRLNATETSARVPSRKILAAGFLYR